MPTPYSDLNAVLDEFVAGARHTLGETFVAAYLHGSFALGDFDRHSDVDFLVVVDHDVTDTALPALQTLHARVYRLASPWAQHLEGSYIPRDLLRRGASHAPLLYLDNTASELVRSSHDNTLVVRWTLREHGITLAGPAPASLVDPVDPDALRREVAAVMRDWAAEIFAAPERLNNRWSQPFAVLSYCRMLHTLDAGIVTSKPVAAAWARRALDRRWSGLIQRAWKQRPNPSKKARQPADPDDIQSTLRFIRYALDILSQTSLR